MRNPVQEKANAGGSPLEPLSEPKEALQMPVSEDVCLDFASAKVLTIVLGSKRLF